MPARLNFKEIAENNDIYEVAQYLGLTITKDRATCPVCESDRALQFYAETNSFYCHSIEKGGDCISLVAHVKSYSGQYPAAKELADRSGTATAARTETATTPQKPGGRTEKSQPAPPKTEKAALKGFDKTKFADSLDYDGEVEKLGKENAELYRIGTKRGKLYLPICPPDVEPVCWAELHEGKLRLPDEWLPNNVVRLRRA